jgi:hypothetical protein
MQRGQERKLKYEHDLLGKAVVMIGAACGAKPRDIEEAWGFSGRKDEFSIEAFRVQKARHKLILAEKNKK